MDLHPDFRDLLAEFVRAGVRFALVGGYAVGHHGKPRATKDLDLLVSAKDDNLDRVADAVPRQNYIGAKPQYRAGERGTQSQCRRTSARTLVRRRRENNDGHAPKVERPSRPTRLAARTGDASRPPEEARSPSPSQVPARASASGRPWPGSSAFATRDSRRDRNAESDAGVARSG